jgi:hypothetical protein
MFEVLTEQLDKEWWGDYRKRLQERFRQEELLICGFKYYKLVKPDWDFQPGQMALFLLHNLRPKKVLQSVLIECSHAQSQCRFFRLDDNSSS